MSGRPCGSASGPQAAALPEPRSSRTGQVGGAERGGKVSPSPALAPAPGIPALPCAGKRGPGSLRVTPGRPRPGRERVSGGAGRFLRRPPPPSERGLPPATCLSESRLAGASSRGRAGSRDGAGAREKAGGPGDRPGRTPEPRGRRPVLPGGRLSQDPSLPGLASGSAQPPRRSRQLGSGGRSGSPHPSPMQPFWEDRFPQPYLSWWGWGGLSPPCPRGDLTPTCPGAALSLVDMSQASRGAVMGLMPRQLLLGSWRLWEGRRCLPGLPLLV